MPTSDIHYNGNSSNNSHGSNCGTGSDAFAFISQDDATSLVDLPTKPNNVTNSAFKSPTHLPHSDSDTGSNTDCNIVVTPLSASCSDQSNQIIKNDTSTTAPATASTITSTFTPTTKKKNVRSISFDEQNILNTSTYSRKINLPDSIDWNNRNDIEVDSINKREPNVDIFVPDLSAKKASNHSITNQSQNENTARDDGSVPNSSGRICEPSPLILEVSVDESEDEVSGHNPKKILQDDFDDDDDDDDDEETSSVSSSDNVKICLPIPPFIYRFLSSHIIRRKVHIHSIEDVAKKILSEYETKTTNTEPNNYVKGDEEKMKDIWVGDIGLALFWPFDFDIFGVKSVDDIACDLDSFLSLSDDEDSCTDSDISECRFDDIIMDIDPDEEPVPKILSNDQMKEIVRRGLPPSVQLMTWKRAYSLRRDGDYFGTMFDKCCFYKNTLIVIKTTEEDLLGGFCDTAWEEQKKSGSLQRSMSFFGGGRAFLFATAPDLTEEEMKEEEKTRRTSKDKIHFYRWTGENDYSQICDNKRGSLGMGGGGEFGFFLQRDFTIGTTGRCYTFRNPPLIKSNNGCFDILDLEVYGFSSMLERMSPNPNRSSLSYSSFGSTGKQSRHSSSSSIGRQSSFSSSTRSVVSFLE